MRDDHVGENAELYALGELDELEAARVEHHARTCDECTRRLGEAEATVLQLIESGNVPTARPAPLDRRVRFAPPASRTPAWIAAVAAAFVIGLLPWGVMMTQRPVASTSSQPAIDAMLAGHFAHAPLVALRPGVPAAKVIYPRESGWIYILVGAGQDSFDVATVVKGNRTIVASLAPSGVTRAVFVNVPGRVDAVELLQSGTPVAGARIAYAP
jgi:anti-sigma factor RsiW